MISTQLIIIFFFSILLRLVAGSDVNGPFFMSDSVLAQGFVGPQMFNEVDTERRYAGESRRPFSVPLPVDVHHKSNFACASGVRRIITVGLAKPTRSMLLDQSEDSTGRAILDFLYSNLGPGNVLCGLAGSAS